MIDYHTFHQIHHLHQAQRLAQAQIAAALNLDEKTVAHWLQTPQYQPRQCSPRPSKLDPYKGAIVRLLEAHPYSGAQIFQRLKEKIGRAHV